MESGILGKFLHFSLLFHLQVSQHLVQQPSPQSYYNNPSPQNVASPQGGGGYYGQNPSPHPTNNATATQSPTAEQYYAQQAAAAAQQQQVRLARCDIFDPF